MKQFSKHKRCEEKHFLFEIRAKVPDYVIFDRGSEKRSAGLRCDVISLVERRASWGSDAFAFVCASFVLCACFEGFHAFEIQLCGPVMSSEEETCSNSSELSISSGDECFANEIVDVIKPYQFEPEFSSGEEGDVLGDEEMEEEENEASRTTNSDW